MFTYLLAFSTSIAFKNESLSSWLSSTRSVIKDLILYYAQDFSKLSVDHPAHSDLVSSLDMAFLPKSESEVAFSGYYVTAEPCTTEKPYVFTLFLKRSLFYLLASTCSLLWITQVLLSV